MKLNCYILKSSSILVLIPLCLNEFGRVGDVRPNVSVHCMIQRRIALGIARL
jgi:hypothetical protein